MEKQEMSKMKNKEAIEKANNNEGYLYFEGVSSLNEWMIPHGSFHFETWNEIAQLREVDDQIIGAFHDNENWRPIIGLDPGVNTWEIQFLPFQIESMIETLLAEHENLKKQILELNRDTKNAFTPRSYDTILFAVWAFLRHCPAEFEEKYPGVDFDIFSEFDNENINWIVNYMFSKCIAHYERDVLPYPDPKK